MINTFSRLLACGLLWLGCLTAAPAAPQSAAGPAPLARSALTTVQASVAGEWVTLRLQYTGSQAPLISKDVSVQVGGHILPVTARGDGSYVLPVKQLGTSATPDIQVIVGHDGIREVLEGRLTLPESAASTAEGSGHNQTLWWVINIGIVFAVAMFLSNRKKKPEEPAE